MKILLPLFLSLFLLYQESFGQVEPAGEWASTEIEVSYFGEMLLHPGLKIGLNLPFTTLSIAKEKSSKKRGTYFVERKRQYIVGANLASYFQVENHQGYLLNGEFGYRVLKTKSYKPEKMKFWEVGIGAGLYHYELSGQSFEFSDSSFTEIKGRGNAFMPSLYVSWGRSIRISSFRSLIFIKTSSAWEIPFNIGAQQRIIVEVGMSIPLIENK